MTSLTPPWRRSWWETLWSIQWRMGRRSTWCAGTRRRVRNAVRFNIGYILRPKETCSSQICKVNNIISLWLSHKFNRDCVIKRQGLDSKETHKILTIDSFHKRICYINRAKSLHSAVLAQTVHWVNSSSHIFRRLVIYDAYFFNAYYTLNCCCVFLRCWYEVDRRWHCHL